MEPEMEQTNEKITYEGTRLLNEDDEMNSARLLLLQRLSADQGLRKNPHLLNDSQQLQEAQASNMNHLTLNTVGKEAYLESTENEEVSAL